MNIPVLGLAIGLTLLTAECGMVKTEPKPNYGTVQVETETEQQRRDRLVREEADQINSRKTGKKPRK